MSNLKQKIQELKLALAQERNENPVQVTDNGNISVYKPGRKFPMTASPEMWAFVLEHAESIRAATGTAERKVG